MSIKKIENGRYWNAAWQLVDGCTPCSPGCDHCWSAGITHRFNQYPDNPLGELSGCLTDQRGKFNGVIKIHPDRLSIPMKRRKLTVYAVWNDLFHEAVPESFRDDAYGIMKGIDRHTYLILTKRPENMARYMIETTLSGWSKDHIWHGMTVCNQQEADAKIPVFLQVPGKKFLSIEPMLGPIYLPGAIGHWENVKPNRFTGRSGQWIFDDEIMNRIDAVILGGETGPGARPMHPDWVRSVRDQCAAAGVPFFFKGWGDTPHLAWGPVRQREWKKTTGRLLDGRTHDDLPWVAR